MRNKGLLLVSVIAVLVAACGGGGETVADGGEVEIVMTEYEFEPSEIHLSPGTTVSFVLTNEGEKDHELMAGQEVHIEDGVPHGFESDFFDTVEDLTIDPPDALETSMEGMDMGDESMSSDTTMGDMDDESEMAEDEHMDEEMDVMVVRGPAQTATITFTVTEASIGEWEFGCFEEDGAHWDDGMRGTIVVEES